MSGAKRTAGRNAGPEEEPGDLGRRVQQLCNEHGLTQRRLAEPAYTPAYISTLEAGRVRPSEAAVRHIAERLGVTYEELMTGRPARLATALRLELVEAQRTLATGAAEDSAAADLRLLAEADRRGETSRAQELLHRLLGELHPDRGSATRAAHTGCSA